MQLRADPLLLAALALPGLGLTPEVQAASAPTEQRVDLRWSHYEDFQPQAERMRIWAPSIAWLKPLGTHDALNLTLLADSMSGASPLFHDTLSGASGEGVNDFRKAADLAWTHYFDSGEWTVGTAFSKEQDYESRTLRVGLSLDSEDRNQTWRMSVAAGNDEINPVNGLVLDQFRRTREFELGYTRILSPVSLLAFGASYSDGRGYYDDPYKPLDTRPHARYQRVLSARYHLHLEDSASTLRLFYRFYADNWEVDAHSLEFAWQQHFGKQFSITPSLRYHTQSAAYFYADPPFGTGFELGKPYSGDTRLAAFGAWTVGVELARPLWSGWSGELRFDFYRQQSNWRWFGQGSPDILPLSARIYEVGLSKRW